ncbi:uncharacterized protein LOC143601193 [Bidens hawaiensis]|uniref:uncharacterized protein LOC143601193 n=1 Tax=Bidens hawaiensis TaxID=980011 RepID=UPI004049C66B
MAPNTPQSKFSLKLMVHKEEMKVIFAEADSNFVDTLFSIMTLPMTAIVRLFRTRPDEEVKPIRSLNNLYQSLHDLCSNCTSAEKNKWMLLNPRTSSYDVCRKLKLNINDQEPTRHYICQDIGCSRQSGACFSISSLAKCSNYGKMMDREVKYEDSTSGDDCEGGVFVSDLASYIVTDDLCVMPNSPISIVQLLCELGITAVSFLDAMTIDIGVDQSDDLKKMLLQPAYCPDGAAYANLSRFQNSQGYCGEMHCIYNFRDSRVDGRYLKTSAKFILSDDLVITPLSSFSSVTMLGKLNVPFNDFEVVKVSIGVDEV